MDNEEKRRETALLRHTQEVLRRATLDVFLRRGELWDAVRACRHQLQNGLYLDELREWRAVGNHCRQLQSVGEESCPGCLECQPPPETDDATVAVPPSLMNQAKPWLAPLQAVQEQIGVHGATHIQSGVTELYYRFEQRFAGLPPAVRQAFFITCLQFDPPPDQLLEYADSALEWLTPRRAIGGFTSIPDPRPQAFGLPIVWMPDPVDLEIAVAAREREHAQAELDALKAAIVEELSARGLDAGEIVHAAERQVRPAQSAAPSDKDVHYAFVQRTTTPYIRVDRTTNSDDVRRAFSAIRAMQRETPSPSRPPRDVLVCVQCAILYDQCGWSHKQIAERFGWAVKYPPAQMPRSETVRQHVAEGRCIMGYEKPAD